MNVYSTATADTTLKPFSVNIPAGNVTVGSTGSNAPINTVPPFQALNFIIALNGLYPPRD
jgi:microcystin-dependent protein